VLIIALFLAAAPAGPAPAALSCLARHYPVTPMFERGRWVAALPDGTRIVADDGKSKTFDETLANPTIEDLFRIPYRVGPILPVTAVDQDPGRVRIAAVLAAAYGGKAVAGQQVRVLFLGNRVRVHRKIAAALARVEQRLVQARAADARLAPYLRRLSGGFAQRKIAGTDRVSAHAFGIAVDLDSSQSDYWRWQRATPLRWRNRIPQAIVDAFETEGFIWGGRWYHYDTMHFEYRPELLDPACRAEVRVGPDSPALQTAAGPRRESPTEASSADGPR
jgi:hypothetical protein